MKDTFIIHNNSMASIVQTFSVSVTISIAFGMIMAVFFLVMFLIENTGILICNQRSLDND